MVVARLIERKRDGGALGPAEWRALIREYTAGRLPDYQMSALLMAVVFRGLSPDELNALTDAMLASGERLPRGSSKRPRVDKHSTGGVGDKTSLILAPLLAACGCDVPMMSGRGLGHTGGTLDKLESIPGFRVALTPDEFSAQLEAVGAAMLGQSERIVPADRLMYALRDVTGTVPSVPLISASIMSKKLAEQLDALVLDVKVGSGAFLPDESEARRLALTMIELGEATGCRTVALLTAMDRPLGRACGNALEVVEVIECLRGGGPDDVMKLSLELAAEMLLMSGLAGNREIAINRARGVISSGAALDRFRQMVAAQGGDERVIDAPELLPTAPVQLELTLKQQAVMPVLPARLVGEVVVDLGGGRRTATDSIDHAVGIELLTAPGDVLPVGRPVLMIHARDTASAEAARSVLEDGLQGAIVEGRTPLPLVIGRLDSSNITNGNGVDQWDR